MNSICLSLCAIPGDSCSPGYKDFENQDREKISALQGLLNCHNPPPPPRDFPLRRLRMDLSAVSCYFVPQISCQDFLKDLLPNQNALVNRE